jgi:hypothetical protein
MIHRFRVLSLLILLTQPIVLPSQTANKTFSKSFNTEERGTVRIDLPGAIDVKIWENPTIRFEISVGLPSGNMSMLNELATVGRYNLVAKPSEGEDVLVITAPNLQKQVKVKGEALHESVAYTVWIPKNMGIELPNAVSMADKK